jgi:hypothetical protein
MNTVVSYKVWRLIFCASPAEFASHRFQGDHLVTLVMEVIGMNS